MNAQVTNQISQSAINTQSLAFAPKSGVQSSVFDGMIARTSSLKSSPLGSSTLSKPATYGTGGTTPTMPKSPIKRPPAGYNRPVSPRVTNILSEVYGKARPVVPAIPAAGAGGVITTAGLATATTIAGSVLVALGILSGDNNPIKVLNWIKGTLGIDEAKDQLISASTAFGFIKWNANKIASVLKTLNPEQSARLIVEATRLGKGMREGERFGPKDVTYGMTAVLKSIGLDEKGEKQGKKPKVKLPSKPLDQIRIERGKDQKTGLIPIKPRKKTFLVPNVPAQPQIAKPAGGGVIAPVVKGVEMERPFKQDGTQDLKKKQKLHDNHSKKPMRASASSQSAVETQNDEASRSRKAESNRISQVKRKFSQKITSTVHNNSGWSRKQAYEWLIKNDPQIAAAHLGLSKENSQLLSNLYNYAFSQYRSEVIDLFLRYGNTINRDYATKAVGDRFAYASSTIAIYERLQSKDPAFISQQLGLDAAHAEMLKTLCADKNPEERQIIFQLFAAFKNEPLNIDYAKEAYRFVRYKNPKVSVIDVYDRVKNADIEILGQRLNISRDTMDFFKEILRGDSLKYKEKIVEFLNHYGKNFDQKYMYRMLIEAVENYPNIPVADIYTRIEHADQVFAKQVAELDPKKASYFSRLYKETTTLLNKEKIVTFLTLFHNEKFRIENAKNAIDLARSEKSEEVLKAYARILNLNKDAQKLRLTLDKNYRPEFDELILRSGIISQAKIVHYLQKNSDNPALIMHPVETLRWAKMTGELGDVLKDY
jgi:hypothetical protein